MGTTAGSAVQIWDCDGSDDSQKWFRPIADSMQLSPVSAPSLCLDTNNGATNDNNDVVLAVCNGASASQKWFLDEQNRLSILLNPSKCIAVFEASMAEGAKLVVFDCQITAPDHFKWYPAACKCQGVQVCSQRLDAWFRSA